MVKTKTTLIFNQELKDFIRKCKIENNINDSTNINQIQVRTWFINNAHLINKNYTHINNDLSITWNCDIEHCTIINGTYESSNYIDIFILMILLISNLDDINSFDNLLECTNFKFYNNDNIINEELSTIICSCGKTIEYIRCCCGQLCKFKNTKIYRHKLTNLQLRIGNGCAMKYEIINKQIIDIIHEINYEINQLYHERKQNKKEINMIKSKYNKTIVELKRDNKKIDKQLNNKNITNKEFDVLYFNKINNINIIEQYDSESKYLIDTNNIINNRINELKYKLDEIHNNIDNVDSNDYVDSNDNVFDNVNIDDNVVNYNIDVNNDKGIIYLIKKIFY